MLLPLADFGFGPALNLFEEHCNAVGDLPPLELHVPDLLYPGVYVVETSHQVHAIDGVPTSTDSLAGSLDTSRASHSVASPEWTDGNAHDPGITTLEFFGWAAESLAFGVALALGLGTEASSSHRRQSATLDPPP
jgi:hypothetical protein